MKQFGAEGLTEQVFFGQETGSGKITSIEPLIPLPGDWQTIAVKTLRPACWEDVQTGLLVAEKGTIIDLSALATPEQAYTFFVGNHRMITLRGAGKIENVAFVFGSGNRITIENLHICSADQHVHSSGACTGAKGYSPLYFTGEGNSLTLVGHNSAVSGQISDTPIYGAGIGVPQNAKLRISANSPNDSLKAVGGFFGAGIGGGFERSAGTVVITGGKITAVGGYCGAGIGGGFYGSGGTLAVFGGVVTTAGGESSAGIGGGYFGSGGMIAISGGVVTAAGGDTGTGIGGGNSGGGGKITISGGVVTAKGGSFSAGIGDGIYGSGGVLTISGGSIKTYGGEADINRERGVPQDTPDICSTSATPRTAR